MLFSLLVLCFQTPCLTTNHIIWHPVSVIFPCCWDTLTAWSWTIVYLDSGVSELSTLQCQGCKNSQPMNLKMLWLVVKMILFSFMTLYCSGIVFKCQLTELFINGKCLFVRNAISVRYPFMHVRCPFMRGTHFWEVPLYEIEVLVLIVGGAVA